MFSLVGGSTMNQTGRLRAARGSVSPDSVGCPRILYLMHIDWDFIWQRPHELAKQLAKEYQVQVVFAYGRHRGVMRHNDRSGLVLRPFFQLPLRQQSRLLADINGVLLRFVFRVMIWSSHPDIIWLTSPEQVEYIPSGYQGKVVYDCMDDALAFPQPAAFVGRMRRDEATLVARSDLVLTSSAYLGAKLSERYGTPARTRLIRNGCSRSNRPVTNETSRGADRLWHLGYIGTLANVDVEAITELVKSVPDVCLDLVGPGTGWAGATGCPRLQLLGTLEHQGLWKFASTCCCLIAPFPRTTLTQGVDPVKLYEYVSWGKPIVALKYPEIERFSDFVEFYESPQDLVRVVSRMRSEGFVRKYSEEQRMAFLRQNTWDARGMQVRQELRDLLGGGG